MTSPSPSEPRTSPLYHAALEPAAAIKLLATTLAAWFIAIIVLAAARVPFAWTLELSELVLVALPPCYVRWRRLPIGALGLTRPRVRFVGAAVLVGCSSWLIEAVLWGWLSRHGDTRGLERAISRPPLVMTLVLACVLAPIGEEMLYRGILARSLATKLPAAAAIAISAALFSASHMSLAQLGPTFTFGLALAFIALRADSIVPTIVAHALNNTVVIVLSRVHSRYFLWLLDTYTAVALALAIAASGTGLALAAKRAT